MTSPTPDSPAPPDRSTRPVPVIRPAREGDAPALLAYINTLSAERTWVQMQGVVLTLAQEEAWLADRLSEMARGDGVTLVVELAGPAGADDSASDPTAGGAPRIVGSAGVARGGPVQPHVGVFGIALLPGLRGQGVGGRLLRAALRAARRDVAGLTLFQLDVYGPNAVARRLYARHGFVDYATLPGGVLHRGEPVDLVSMVRPADLPLLPD